MALHVQRFFSYLSAFAGFMLVLVTGGNYFVLFVGWEGMSQCLRSINMSNYGTIESCLNLLLPACRPVSLGNLLNTYLDGWAQLAQCKTELKFLLLEMSIYYLAVLPPLGRINLKSSLKRVGPHNIDIISLIVGSVLGDSHLEKRAGGIGTRVIFEQSNKNVEYLMWLHQFLSERGYCNPEKPKLFKRIKQKNEVFFHYRFNSYTFYSFNWIYDMFYLSKPNQEVANISKDLGFKKVKRIPGNLSEYITPLALAIWFMDDGSKINKTVRIATNCFTYEEVEFLSTILFNKYNLNCHPVSGGPGKGYILYISTSSMTSFSKIVKPYMIPSMYYKLG
jgi:hypothetical protein